MKRRDFVVAAGGMILAVSSGTYAFRILKSTDEKWSLENSPLIGKKYGMLIDLNKCKPE